MSIQNSIVNWRRQLEKTLREIKKVRGSIIYQFGEWAIPKDKNINNLYNYADLLVDRIMTAQGVDKNWRSK